MATHLGMDTEKDEDFLWIAAEAYDAEVPPPWKRFFDDSGEVYFHNTRTGDVSRDHPLDHPYPGRLGSRGVRDPEWLHVHGMQQYKSDESDTRVCRN